MWVAKRCLLSNQYNGTRWHSRIHNPATQDNPRTLLWADSCRNKFLPTLNLPTEARHLYSQYLQTEQLSPKRSRWIITTHRSKETCAFLNFLSELSLLNMCIFGKHLFDSNKPVALQFVMPKACDFENLVIEDSRSQGDDDADADDGNHLIILKNTHGKRFGPTDINLVATCPLTSQCVWNLLCGTSSVLIVTMWQFQKEKKCVWLVWTEWPSHTAAHCEKQSVLLYPGISISEDVLNTTPTLTHTHCVWLMSTTGHLLCKCSGSGQTKDSDCHLVVAQQRGRAWWDWTIFKMISRIFETKDIDFQIQWKKSG